MIAWIAAVLTTIALACHEWLEARAPARLTARRFCLAAALGCAVLWGIAAKPQDVVRRWIGAGGTVNRPVFDAAGDATLADAPSLLPVRLRFPESDSRASVMQWQTMLRDRIEQLLRIETSAATPPTDELVVQETKRFGSVTRQFGSFRGVDGVAIPAFVFIPEGARNQAAVLVIPGHGRGVVGPAGIFDDYQHAAALRLAQAGFVTMTIELRGFGYLGDERGFAHRVAAQNAIEAGSCYKAYVGSDLRRALRILRARTEVDAARVGVAGASLGGELATMLGALDPSIRAVCSHAYGGELGMRPGLAATLPPALSALRHGCHLIPGINRVAVREDWFRLIAPRPLQLRRGTRETTDPGPLRDALAPVYALFGSADALDVASAPGDHEFFVEDAIRFFKKRL